MEAEDLKRLFKEEHSENWSELINRDWKYIEWLENKVLSLSEVAPKEEQIIEVHGEALNLNEIVSIYDIERDKNMFLNRQAGFIVILKDGTKKEFYERIPYESYPHEISAKKRKWFDLQTEVSDQWKKVKN